MTRPIEAKKPNDLSLNELKESKRKWFMSKYFFWEKYGHPRYSRQVDILFKKLYV